MTSTFVQRAASIEAAAPKPTAENLKKIRALIESVKKELKKAGYDSRSDDRLWDACSDAWIRQGGAKIGFTLKQLQAEVDKK